MFILGMIIICSILFVAGIIFLLKSEEEDEPLFCIIGILALGNLFILPIAFGCLHGYTNYYPSNNKDLARITAVTMEQGRFYKTTL
jgi:RsiW-degrading membrane proteinase PrsW (M82 family)